MFLSIVPDSRPGAYSMGRVTRVTFDDIVNALGFAPNVLDDPDKVAYSWSALVTFEDGSVTTFSIWDWKGSHLFNEWSFHDPDNVLDLLFPFAPTSR